MATLILTAAGTALGGPIGGALGSFVGQAIDQQLPSLGGRKGPRLGDLSVQTSTYGQPLPRIYGRMRVAGSVVWATDLQEIEAVQGGGKGSPQRTVYHYLANFAVALSSRPIRSVRRIWADGKLIRGLAGDFKIATGFRLLNGSEDQPLDPLIASAETIALTPAYRGTALAVFEGMELKEFGNRIPSLTFEIEADDSAGIGQILCDSSGGLIDADEVRQIGGFAAHGGSIREGLAPLIDVAGVELIERDGRLRSPEQIAPSPIERWELGCDADGVPRPSIERIRAPQSALPTRLTLRYYDPARDYQAGQMNGSTGGSGTGQETIDLPAVLDGGAAKMMAEQFLAGRWRSADRLRMRLPPSRMGLRPGHQLQVEGLAGNWSIRSVSIDGMAVAIEAATHSVALPPLNADPGRSISEPDLPIGRTELLLFELPAFDDQPASRVQAFAAGSNEGLWRQVPIELLAGTSPLAGGSLIRRAVLGRCETVLHPRSPLGFDELSTVDVALTNPEQVLLNADWDALATGANLALIGEELIQFARAQQLGARRYRLSRLLRGRRATEWAATQHQLGDAFCMFDANCVLPVELPIDAMGVELRCIGHGIADSAPFPSAMRLISGEALRPPSPCKLAGRKMGGSIFLNWVRRSFRQWHWVDGIGDVADGFPELYRVTVSAPNSTTVLETENRSLLLEPPVIPDEIGQQVIISVATLGPSALSHPATATIVT